MDRFLSLYSAMDVDVGQNKLFHTTLRQGVFKGNDYHLFIVGLVLAHSIPYYTINLFHTVLGWWLPDQLERFRWCQGKHAERKLVQQCILFVTCYHILSPLFPIYLYKHFMVWHPTAMSDEVPGVLTCLLQLPLAYLVTDLLFYWGHRLLHWGPLYRSVHKQHHEFHITVGWACEYAHPVEWLFGNVMPVIAGPIIFRFHFFVFCAWMILAISGTTWGHSGFKFPIALSNGFHDYHHSHNVGNYGSMQHWDWLCGTDTAYRNHLRRCAEKKAKKVTFLLASMKRAPKKKHFKKKR